jgi:hypothetical protein
LVRAGAELPLVVHGYPLHLHHPEPLELGLDEAACEQVGRRAFRRGATPAEIAQWLYERTIIAAPDGGGGDRAAVLGVDREGGLPAFRILGREVAVDVGRTAGGTYRVRRVVGRSPAAPRSERLALLSAPSIRFLDATAAGTMLAEAFEPLWSQVRAADSYLAVWEAYNDLEREAVERRASRIGSLQYMACSRLPDGAWEFRLRDVEGIEARLARLHEGGDLELAAVRRAGEPAREVAGRTGRSAAHGFAGRCAGVSAAGLTVRLAGVERDVDPPPRGFLEPTLVGDRVRLKRRLEAYERLRSGRGEMPQLAPLLEGLPVPAARLRPHEPRSADSVAAFGGEPTPRQVEALRVALNTPDIALIQGPPGTGKTRVIAALQARLGEVTSSADGLAGQILLTSFQHEAVENAAANSSVFGIPAVKVDTVGRTDVFDALEQWRAERMEALGAELAGREAAPARLALQEARMLHHAYRKSPGGLEGAQRLLRNLLHLARDRVPAELSDELEELERKITLQRARDVADEDRPRVIRAVRGLRSTTRSFEDDGPQRAAQVLEALGATDLLSDEDVALLKRCAERPRDMAPALLKRIGPVRERLLDRLLGAGESRRLDTVHHDVDHLATEVIDAILANVVRSRDGWEVVLAEYLRDLRADPAGVRTALQEYTAVLAATCQQSVSMVMAGARQARGGEGGVVFDTVLVDEAARANPLDLFIPLSRARRRIVLVGDHRQLPHVLDTEVERRLERARAAGPGEGGVEERLRTSLFQRLFTLLREREQVDGIRRTVTLDVQYRMHPVLGEFVSRTFYEPHGEGFRSGGAPESFAHGLARYGNASAAFVHVPRERGTELRGRSKSRPAEARWMATEVRRILDERPELSVGVVAFYRAQIDLLNQELAAVGVTEALDDGGYRVRAEWKAGHDGRGRVVERLRVGTVDAFQGREFDVVLLSMARCNTRSGGTPLELRRRLGHLMLENRLCVAMSRQRRLLVVVGDREMIEGSDPGAVPALARFLELCDGEHGVRFVA